MHVVALLSPPADPSGATQALARALGVTAFDVRPRLNLAAGGPSVLVYTPSEATARSQADTLRGEGLDVVVLPAALPEPFAVRHLEVTDDGMTARSRAGEEVSVPLASLRAILFGTRVRVAAKEETYEVRGTSVSLGPSALVTGLPSVSRTRETVTHRTAEERELYAALVVSDAIWLITEGEIAFEPDGAEAYLTRAAGLRGRVDALRAAAPRAAFDSHLLQRAAQVQILGRNLAPEEHLPLLLALRSMVVVPR